MTNAVTLAGLGSEGSSFGFRNRIINGDMRIDQRNAGASVTPTASQYLLDRFSTQINVASKFSVQQLTATPPVGFTHYLRVTSLSSYSVAAGDVAAINQSIEGFNVADLGWGTASAATVTLSFWVRSTLTGNFGGTIQNNGQARSYPFAYTINAANTWEQKTITIPGDTSGTWLKDNGIGITVKFSIGSGSTFSGTANAWSSSLFLQPTGSTSVISTNAATWDVTGVQLEKGSTATPFEFRSIGQELELCQRYYYRTTYGTNFVSLAVGIVNTTTSAAQCAFAFPVTMRATPTINYSSLNIYDGSVAAAITSLETQSSSTTSGSLNANATSGGLVVGRTGVLIGNLSSTYLDASAEL